MGNNISQPASQLPCSYPAQETDGVQFSEPRNSMDGPGPSPEDEGGHVDRQAVDDGTTLREAVSAVDNLADEELARYKRETDTQIDRFKADHAKVAVRVQVLYQEVRKRLETELECYRLKIQRLEYQRVAALRECDYLQAQMAADRLEREEVERRYAQELEELRRSHAALVAGLASTPTPRGTPNSDTSVGCGGRKVQQPQTPRESGHKLTGDGRRRRREHVGRSIWY